MPQYFPVILPGGQSLQGASLGFHAYSLRIDNLTNQWLLEETSLAWIPPYSLGVCLRLYGTSVALLLNRPPQGQPQLPPIPGEESVGVYSDQLRTEVGGAAVRQFALVQTVSDLTEGPQPALPPVGVDRLYADTSGNIHHLHTDGTDLILYDNKQPLNGVLVGTLPSPGLAAGAAAANVGALGGALSGNLPNPSLAAGAAAANVGALGGALVGSLPSPALAFYQQAGANTTVTGGGWQNLCNISLPAGSWVFWIETEIQYNGGSGNFYIRIVDQTATELDRAYVSVGSTGPAYQHISKMTLQASNAPSYAWYFQALADNTLSVVTPYARQFALRIG